MKKALLRWLLSSSDLKDLSEMIPILAEWLARTGSINNAWIKPEVYRLFQSHGFHLVRNHYYGVLPDTSKLSQEWWNSIPYQSAFNQINKMDIETVFESILKWADELKPLPRELSGGFYWNNDMFPPLDAIVLYGMLREFKPKRLLEIGSGFSTEIALLASRHSETVVHCVEPYPSSRLLAVEPRLGSLIRLPIQKIEPSLFTELQDGDFLFIDTTHTVKIDSDVNYLIFNVLPRLNSGVFVHIHDIFLPYEYPKRWYDEISIFWNEQYLLLAYLLENPDYEIVLPNHLISIQKKEMLRKRLETFDIWDLTNNLGGASGASMWLRRR